VFLSRDPALDGSNWFGYAKNSPRRLVDPTGLEAGDEFKSSDAAAKDAAKCYGGGERESGGWIYSYEGTDGSQKYSYTVATSSSNVNIHLKPISKGPPNSKSQGTWHTHGTTYDSPDGGIGGNYRRDTFSDPDIRNDFQVASEGNGDNHYISGGDGVVYKHIVRDIDGSLFPPTKVIIIPIGRWHDRF
jgi:hypothetical protein